MNKYRLVILILLLVLVCSFLFSGNMGAANISFRDWIAVLGKKLGFQTSVDIQQEAIIWNIRLPRILMGVFVGAALAISGAALQGMFRNPLADPTLIGISSGAALGAAFMIVVANRYFNSFSSVIGISFLSLAAFVGAVAATFTVYMIARQKRKTDVSIMLLSGVAMMAIAEALTGLFIYISDDVELRNLTFWRLGSLGGVTWPMVMIMAVTSIASLLVFSGMHKSFNALSLGEQEAAHLGIPVERLKRSIIICTSIAVGCSVAFCGIIGFLGLVVPHILRMAGITDYRYLFTASFLAGSVLLCWADVVSRTIAVPAEVPIGLITALIGSPVFLMLLYRQKTR